MCILNTTRGPLQMAYPITKPIQTIGINDLYEHNELHLDSSARDSGTNDEPAFTISPPLQNVLAIKVVSVQIPFSYYVFNSTNNTFSLNIESTQQLVTIPPGNYTSSQLAAALQEALNLAYPAGQFTITFLPTTQQLLFRATKPFWFEFLLDDDKPYNTAQAMLGFDTSTASSITVSTGTLYELKAPGVCLVTGPNYLVLTGSPATRIARSMRLNGSTSAHPTPLAIIPVNANPWDIIEYTDATPGYAIDMADGLLQHIQLGLVYGGTNVPVTLNGAPWKVFLQILTERETSVSHYGLVGAGDYALNRSSKRVRMN